MKTNRNTTRRVFVASSAAMTGALLSGCLGRGLSLGESRTEMVEQSFTAPDIESIRVANANGNVTIVAVGTGDIDVRVRKRSFGWQSRLDDIDVSMALKGGELVVETTIDEPSGRTATESATADVEITVPKGEFAPEITDVTSEIGNVTLLDTTGDTTIETDLGDVTVSGARGYLSLYSRLGSVTASEISGLDAAYTQMGDLKVDVLGLRSDVDIGTSVGKVVVVVADDLDLDVLVETTTNIDANLPLRDRYVGSGRLSGKQNAGGNRLYVSSKLGDVSLRSIRRGR